MNNIPETNVQVKLYPSFPDAVNAATQFAFGNHAQHFEGTLFEQGSRYMFSTAMPFERFVQVAEAESVVVSKRTEKRDGEKVLLSTEGDAVDDVSDSTNRPVDRGHVKGITKYLARSAKQGQKYIMPPATLNLRKATATLFTIEGDSTIKPAVLVAASHVRFEITDAQHRREGIGEALRDPSVRHLLLRDGIAVMITFETELSQVHQDFADASKTKPISGSLVAVYDSRLPVNALAIHLTKCSLFKHTVDATSKGSSLSAGSVKAWSTNILRQFVKYAALNSREGDDIWNAKFTQVYGEPSDPGYQRFRDYMVEFIDACTQDIPLFAKLAKLDADDMSAVPQIRKSGGGQVLMTAPGMNILGAIAHTLYRAVYKQGGDIRPWTKKLGAIDWSYKGPLWKDKLIVADKVSTSAKAVKETIDDLESRLGLVAVSDQAA